MKNEIRIVDIEASKKAFENAKVVLKINIKRNCNNCKWLEYVEDTDYEHQDGGFCCNKREYKTRKQELDHLNLLNYKDGRYRETRKSCCELRDGQ